MKQTTYTVRNLKKSQGLINAKCENNTKKIKIK